MVLLCAGTITIEPLVFVRSQDIRVQKEALKNENPRLSSKQTVPGSAISSCTYSLFAVRPIENSSVFNLKTLLVTRPRPPAPSILECTINVFAYLTHVCFILMNSPLFVMWYLTGSWLWFSMVDLIIKLSFPMVTTKALHFLDVREEHSHLRPFLVSALETYVNCRYISKGHPRWDRRMRTVNVINTFLVYIPLANAPIRPGCENRNSNKIIVGTNKTKISLRRVTH